MATIETDQANQADFQVFDADKESHRRRLTRWAIVVVAVVVLALIAWQFVSLHHEVNNLKKTQSAQAAQITALEGQLKSVNSSLNAAVGCLQTPQGLQGLCSKLVH